tara:strand:- start:421 stop:1149 length:729 start_codon:yes stop_codon:yes gene_type:complete
MTDFTLPTEIIDLPSQGKLYPEGHPLSEGKIEMKYMTAKEEDILSNQTYIQNGTVIDRLLKSLVVTKVDFNDILIGDKNSIMIAARVLGYGPEYKFATLEGVQEVDLSKIDNKPLHENLLSATENNFSFDLPTTDNSITFKILTHGDEKKIERELEGLKKINKDSSPDVSTRLKYIITSVNGDSDPPTIRKFVDQALLARDSRALREYISQIQPDVDLTFSPKGTKYKRTIPISIGFFWPDA